MNNFLGNAMFLSVFLLSIYKILFIKEAGAAVIFLLLLILILILKQKG